MGQGAGGAFLLSDDYTVTGNWKMQGTAGLNAIQPVISGSGATRTLLASESGSLCLFDRAAGIVYTLPKPQVGLYFDFAVTTTITSNAAEVDTDAATTFILGAVMVAIADTTPGATAGPKLEAANGTSTVKVSSNGTTTGGIKGQQYRLTCVSGTVWQITGLIYGSGTIATPFA